MFTCVIDCHLIISVWHSLHSRMSNIWLCVSMVCLKWMLSNSFRWMKKPAATHFTLHFIPGQLGIMLCGSARSLVSKNSLYWFKAWWHYKARSSLSTRSDLGSCGGGGARWCSAGNIAEGKRWRSVWVKTTLSWAQISDCAWMISTLLNQNGGDS